MFILLDVGVELFCYQIILWEFFFWKNQCNIRNNICMAQTLSKFKTKPPLDYTELSYVFFFIVDFLSLSMFDDGWLINRTLDQFFFVFESPSTNFFLLTLPNGGIYHHFSLSPIMMMMNLIHSGVFFIHFEFTRFFLFCFVCHHRIETNEWIPCFFLFYIK